LAGKDGEAGDVGFIVDAVGCSQAEEGPLEARSDSPTGSWSDIPLDLQRDILSLFRVGRGRARAQRSGARNRNRERSGRVGAVSITSTITITSTNGHRLLQNKELPVRI